MPAVKLTVPIRVRAGLLSEKNPQPVGGGNTPVDRSCKFKKINVPSFAVAYDSQGLTPALRLRVANFCKCVMNFSV